MLFGGLAQEKLRKAAGHGKLKDHRNFLLERRAIIARRLVQTARAEVTSGPTILLSHEAAEWKKILRAGPVLAIEIPQWAQRLGSTIRIMPGRRTATLPFVRLRAATVVL